MTQATIYKLSTLPFGKVFPKLMGQVISKGNKVLIFCNDEVQVAEYDNLLWSYEQLSFLPHGTNKDENLEEQPILLTDKEDNINSANILVIVGEKIPSNISKFEKVLYMFEANAIKEAEGMVKGLEDAKVKCSYVLQDNQGAWQKVENL